MPGGAAARQWRPAGTCRPKVWKQPCASSSWNTTGLQSRFLARNSPPCSSGSRTPRARSARTCRAPCHGTETSLLQPRPTSLHSLMEVLATKGDGCRLEFTAATSCPPARLRRGSRTSTPARLRRASGEAPGPALRRGSGELVGTRAGRYTSWSVHELVGTRAGGYTSWWVHELVGTRAGRHTFLACLACRAFPSDAGLRRGREHLVSGTLQTGRGREGNICKEQQAAPRSRPSLRDDCRPVPLDALSQARRQRPKPAAKDNSWPTLLEKNAGPTSLLLPAEALSQFSSRTRPSDAKHFHMFPLRRGPRTRLPAEAFSEFSSRARPSDAAPGRSVFTV